MSVRCPAARDEVEAGCAVVLVVVYRTLHDGQALLVNGPETKIV